MYILTGKKMIKKKKAVQELCNFIKQCTKLNTDR